MGEEWEVLLVESCLGMIDKILHIGFHLIILVVKAFD